VIVNMHGRITIKIRQFVFIMAGRCVLCEVENFT
jgi:hypothetical protein